jgi:hypothetical protein
MEKSGRQALPVFFYLMLSTATSNSQVETPSDMREHAKWGICKQIASDGDFIMPTPAHQQLCILV